MAPVKSDFDLKSTEDSMQLVLEERERQQGLWGEQNHPLDKWGLILGEEFGEVSKAILDFDTQSDSDHWNELLDNVVEECVHTAAVAIQIVEFINRKMK
jgi:hypothetical protein